MRLNRNINIITDLKGNKIVLINDIIFKGKKTISWDDVKTYLESYVGEFYEIADTKDIVCVLHFLFTMKQERWNAIMFSMHPC